MLYKKAGQNMPHKNKKKRKLKLVPTILLTLVILFLLGCSITLAYISVVIKDLPEWTIDDLSPEQSSFLYDNEGNVFMELHQTENRTTVELSEIPQQLIDCLIYTEDVRFYKHFGVDVLRVFGAFLADLKSGGFSQGASTLTMQLAKNAILEDQDKKIDRKIKEAFLAIQIEKKLSKDEILYYYLNEVYFGHNAYGVQAAANLYFNKDVSELTLGECATLIGVLPSPPNYSPLLNYDNAVTVRNNVLKNLAKEDPSYAQAVEAALAEPLTVNQGTVGNIQNYTYPWFTDAVIDETEDILKDLNLADYSVYASGLRIYTTLDAETQAYAEEIYANDANFPSSSTSDIVESALIMMDHSNGDILALIGGREYTTKRGFNRAISLERQPGSVSKPVTVYGPAIEAGYSISTVVNDVPTTFGTTYSPSNYDGKYRGVINMRTGLQYSINLAAVKYLQMIGVQTGFDFANKLGFNLDAKNDLGLHIALGGFTTGVSPLQVAQAYGAFGNQGIYNEGRTVLKIEDVEGNVLYEAPNNQKVVMSEETAYLVTNMLETVTKAGTGTNAQMANRAVASKTGTTQLPDTAAFKGKTGNKDAWFAAYTPEYVAVVWMGYDNDTDANGKAQYLRQIYGGKYPALIWKAVMTKASQGLSGSQFTKPSTIVEVAIDEKSGDLPSNLTPDKYISTELFVESNLPTKTSAVWQYAEICNDTGLLATVYCPNRSQKLLFTPPKEPSNNTITGKGLDNQLLMLTKTCTTHTSYTTGGESSTNEENSNGNSDTSVKKINAFSGVVHKSGDSYQVELEWVDGANKSGVLYEIARWEDSDEENVTNFYTYSTPYTDTSIVAGKVYYYKIRAYDEDTKVYGDWSKTLKADTTNATE